MMAVPRKEKRERLTDYAQTRVATKFPHIAEMFFTRHGMQMEYIKLNGSIELGPIVGLSESIVDIVETGTTLKENDLEEIAYIMDATARLIANRVSFKLKFQRIHTLVEELKKVMAAREAGK
jgi:ATP phosphoribosyltransferase